jgi:hypothetical protein
MKRFPITIGVIVPLVLLTCIASTVMAADPTIELLNPPPDGLLELEVGQSYTFDIEIASDEPFILAMATTDAYYPGRGVFWHGNDRAVRTTSAVLHLTITGKGSTVDLPEVSDWPEPGDQWPEGTVPVSIVAGVRYSGGVVISERFAFAVVVP